MRAQDWLKERLDEYRDDPEFVLESLILDINEQICAAMDRQGVNRRELAQRVGVSRQHITKLLNGSVNVTLRTLVKIACALESRPSFTLAPRKEAQRRSPTVSRKPGAPKPAPRAAAVPS